MVQVSQQAAWEPQQGWLKAFWIRWYIYSFHHGSRFLPFLWVLPVISEEFVISETAQELLLQSCKSSSSHCLFSFVSAICVALVSAQWLLPAQIRLSCISIFGAKTWVGVRSATTARWCLCHNCHCTKVLLLTPGLKRVFLNVSWVKVFIHQNY